MAGLVRASDTLGSSPCMRSWALVTFLFCDSSQPSQKHTHKHTRRGAHRKDRQETEPECARCPVPSLYLCKTKMHTPMTHFK